MVKKFVVNPFSITYEQIQNDLRVLIANNKNTFTDFFNDGSGSSVIDIAASLGAFFAFHIIAQRKEFTLEQAVSYKSLIGNAYDKGYNVSRGTNLRVNLTTIPETTGTLTAWTTIGVFEEYDVTLMKDVSFQAGVPCTLEVVIGNRSSEGRTVATNSVALFRFTSDDITDDMRLLLNDSELAYSTEIKDLLNDKYLVQSNSYGSINVFYLQAGNSKYSVGDTLVVDYISRNSVDMSDVSASSFYIAGFSVNDVTLKQERVLMEAKDSIRINASLHSETSGVIKARADFKKVLKEQDDTIASINDEDIQPGRIGITILKKDTTALSESDIERYENLVGKNTVSGVASLYYSDAHRYDTDLKVALVGSEDIATSRTLIPSVQSFLAAYENSLGEYINFDDVEDYIEKELEGIKVARITTDSSAWESKNYRISDTCIATKFNNKTYYVDSIIYKTGETNPNWDSLEDGYIVDGDILWKEYLGEPEGIMIWKPGVTVKLGKLVVDTLDENKRVFECVGYRARTGETEPDWSLGKPVLFDNEIVWSKVEPEQVTLENWESNKLLSVGKVIKKRYNEGVEESYENQTTYSYFSEIFGGNFYTAQPLDNNVECFSDETLTSSIGVASDLDADTRVVTITPVDSEESLTGSYEDYTVYKYLGGVTGVFYTETSLSEGSNCYSDSAFKNLLGTVQIISETTIRITNESEVITHYYKVADYAMPSSDTEPDWSVKTLEGYIEDGDRLLWKEASYPIRFIKLANNSYVKFNSNITID